MAASKQTKKQASKHTHTRAQCSNASVGLTQARPNKLHKVTCIPTLFTLYIPHFIYTVHTF